MRETFACNFCHFVTDNKSKADRHNKTIKHLICEYGLVCCGLKYRDKHKWVNHKKSAKHLEKFPGPLDLYKLIDLPPVEKKTLNLQPKEAINCFRENNVLVFEKKYDD